MNWYWKAHARPLAGLVLGAALLAAVACGGDDDSPTATSPPAATNTPQATQAPATSEPAPTAPPGSTATATPSQQATATTPPATGHTPTGSATVAVNAVTPRSGTPRFCSAGCAEAVYQGGGVMETLFRPHFQDFLGEQEEEPIVATGYTLDPNLAYLDFHIRQGVQFHKGWGELTAEDVVFSFNDANSNTQPESVHGQAGDFAPLIARLEVLDTYEVRLHYNNFDSRGIRHRFSSFWQTAGITSKAVFDEHGPEGMRDIIVGTGPYEVEVWNQSDRIEYKAIEDHYRQTPYVADLTFIEVVEASTRRSMLETGQVVMTQPSLKDWKALQEQGMVLDTNSGLQVIRNVGMTGNYWEKVNAATGEPIEREIADKPWVSGPQEDDPDRWERARLVRIGLAHAIDREGLVASVMDGFGDGPAYYAYQPHPSHPLWIAGEYVDPSMGGDGAEAGMEYPYDVDLAREFLAAGGYADGFDMEVWVGAPSTYTELFDAVGGAWRADLGINVTMDGSAYQTYRPGLVARTTSTPFLGCGDDANTAFPYDWARGFVQSSWSAGGYGVGMEIPFATENYNLVGPEPDREKRLEIQGEYLKKGVESGLCIGMVLDPVNTMYNPDLVEEYRKLPTAEGTFQTMGNMASLKLK